MIVADASAVIAAVLREPGSKAVRERMLDPRETLHAPHLLDVEVAQVIRRFVARRELDEERGRQALDDFMGLPLHRYAHDLLLPRVWRLRNNLSAYDAVYVALAEALGAKLLTRDARMAKAAGHGAMIELI